MVPWLGFCTFMAGSITIQGSKTPYVMHLGGKNRKKKDRKEKVRGKKEEGI